MTNLLRFGAPTVLASWALLIIIGGVVFAFLLIFAIVTFVRNKESKKILKNDIQAAYTNKDSVEKTLDDNTLLFKKGENYFYGDYIVAHVGIVANKCVLKTYFYYRYGSKIRRACVYIRVVDEGTLEQGRYLSVAACQSVGIL